MRTKLNGLIREEKGAALVLTLVLLLIGGLIIAPLLGHMGTGHTAGQVHEKRMDEFYAADAGIEDAIWRIQYNPPDSWEIHDDPVGSYIYQYPDVLHVNGKSVNVTMIREDLDPTCNEELRYTISSNATGLDGSFTTIDAYLSVYYMDFSGLLDYAIASNGGIGIGQGQGGGGQAAPEIYGDVYIKDRARFDGDEDWIEDGYELYDQTQKSLTWPQYEQLHPYYWDDVKHLEPETAGTISVSGYSAANPYPMSGLYIPDNNQRKLTVTGNGWIEVIGTVYVKGNLHFNPTNEITIILGDQAVLFVDGTVTNTSDLTVSGSGCIIATGNITLNPMFSSGGGDPDDPDFVLILSLQGSTTLQPLGNFHGTVAGHSSVTTQPNNVFRWTGAGGKGLNFPMGVTDLDNLPPVTGLTVQSWLIETGS